MIIHENLRAWREKRTLRRKQDMVVGYRRGPNYIIYICDIS